MPVQQRLAVWGIVTPEEEDAEIQQRIWADTRRYLNRRCDEIRILDETEAQAITTRPG